MAQGIGAQDKDIVPTWFISTTDGERMDTRPPAGWVYIEAIASANWLRRRAFDRIPSYAALMPAGNHPPNGATGEELLYGCPAWPR